MSKVLKITPKTIAFDLVLTAAAWIFFSLWFSGHVPSEDPATQKIVGAIGALPGAGTFWFCLQMFKVTLAHQRKLNAEKR